MRLFASLKTIKGHTLTVYFIARDTRTPLPVRALAVLVAAYVLSPIDLIPDFIPVIGWLDDLFLVALGLAVVMRFTPPEVIASARLQGQQISARPANYFAAAIIVVVWLFALWVLIRWLTGVL